MSGEDEFDVIVVGAGLAGLACAYEVAKAGMQVIVLERGDGAGSKNLSGGRLYLGPLLDLSGDLLEGAPFERDVVSESIVLTGTSSSVTLKVDSNGSKESRHSVTVLRAKLDAFLADKLAEKGGFVLPEQKADRLLFEGNSIVGVQVGPEELRAPIIVGADGALSFLAEQAALRKKREPRHYGVGIKEIVRLDPKTIDDRFNVSAETGAARLYMGEVTRGIPGGGFLYTNKDSISIGLVVHMSELRAWNSNEKFWQLLEAFKSREDVAPLLEGGKTVEYGAHLIPEGGWEGLPSRFGASGLLLCGDAAGLVLNTGITVRGMDFALASGAIAGKSIVESEKEPGRALAAYEKSLRGSFVMEQMRVHKKSAGLLNVPRLYKEYPEQISKIAEAMYRVNDDGRSFSIGDALKKFRKNVLGVKGLKDLWRLYRM